MSFFEKLERDVEAKDSLLCVGLDPHSSDLDRIAAKYPGSTRPELAYKFCKEIIDETHHAAVAFKPNAAFFEALGPQGIEVMNRLVKEMVGEGVCVVLDVKRGDISTTADAYAEAAFENASADCVTLHPYMGYDSVQPFVEKYKGKGVFVLCKTSNPSSNEFETLELKNGEMVYEAVAKKCAAWNKKTNNVGLVVGATDIVALEKARKAAPELWILAPGVGFQGGDLEKAARAGLRSDGMGLLVPVSRGISRAEDPKKAAEDLRDALNSVRETNANANGTEQSIQEYQEDFFKLAMKCGVLKFGSFKLKSGRISPYFFNAGMFDSGAALGKLGELYAETIVKTELEFDVLFGPAYKGIPLSTCIAVALHQKFGMDVPFSYNRKEAKDHGEGGLLVGAPVEGKRVLIVDDVITAGTAIRESLDILSEANAKPVGVVIALDRQERANEETQESAIQAVSREFGLKVTSIVSLDHLLTFAETSGSSIIEISVLKSIHEYRKRYGVQS